MKGEELYETYLRANEVRRQALKAYDRAGGRYRKAIRARGSPDKGYWTTRETYTKARDAYYQARQAYLRADEACQRAWKAFDEAQL